MNPTVLGEPLDESTQVCFCRKGQLLTGLVDKENPYGRRALAGRIVGGIEVAILE